MNGSTARRAWDATSATRWRGTFFVVLAMLITLVFVGRLAELQIVRAGELGAQADNRRTSHQVLYGNRGEIVDVHGTVLASNVTRWDVTVSPRYTRDMPQEDGSVLSVADVLRKLGEITGQDPNALAAALQAELGRNPDSDYFVLAAGLNAAQYEQVRALQREFALPYLITQSRPERTYPLGAVAGNLVGFEGSDGVPLAGLELMQDECLAPTDGERAWDRAADGTEIPGTQRVYTPPIDGATAELTIDAELQYSLQELAAANAERFHARGATIVVARKDGTIAALAEAPSVDPNEPTVVAPEYRGARSFTEAYEPGSTFKTIALAAMLDAGVVAPTDRWEVPWTYSTDTVRVSDASDHATARWTTAGILVYSSNVGMVTMGERMDREAMFEYFERFGLGSETAVGFLGEQPVPLRDPRELDDQSRANIMFGQGIAMTPMQLVSAYLPFINDGVRPPLRLVQSCVAANGERIEPQLPEPVQVVKPETAQSVLDMLELMVAEGWHPELPIQGYRYGAKTGTAEVAAADGSGYDPNQWIVSVMGVLPADDPEYVVLTLIDRPDPSMRIEGASPMMHDTINLLIRHYNLPSSKGEQPQLKTEW